MIPPDTYTLTKIFTAFLEGKQIEYRTENDTEWKILTASQLADIITNWNVLKSARYVARIREQTLVLVEPEYIRANNQIFKIYR